MSANFRNARPARHKPLGNCRQIGYNPPGITRPSTLVLALIFRESASLGLLISAVMSLQALLRSVAYNTMFEAWERRQPVKGRSFRRRCVHAPLFDAGMTVLTVPVIMALVSTGFLSALIFDIGLTASYMGLYLPVHLSIRPHFRPASGPDARGPEAGKAP